MLLMDVESLSNMLLATVNKTLRFASVNVAYLPTYDDKQEPKGK